ncbi:MAG: DNA-binding transcriptional regulator [Kiritimatiellia bacterium]
MQPGRDKLRGIFNYAHLYGPWNIHVILGREGEQKPHSLVALSLYDGIIVGQMMLGLAEYLKSTRKPIVLMDPLDDLLGKDSPFVTLSRTTDDSEAVGVAGAEYFLERGYKQFAYIGEPLNRNWSVIRGRSFCREIIKHGCFCHVYPDAPASVAGQEDEQQLASWLKELPKPVGMLAAMDLRARKIIETCNEIGIRIPEDIAILGIDDDELLCNGCIPTLSSIRRNTEECGFAAAGMLDQLMRREIRRTKIFSYGVKEIVSRDSTQIHALVEDPVVRKAREFIRINACVGIGVPEIVRHLNVSRRLAESRFRAECGRSLLEEIQIVRLERVEKLLRETDLPLTDVCSLSGYNNDVHLRRVFKRHFSCTMREYRKKARNV